MSEKKNIEKDPQPSKPYEDCANTLVEFVQEHLKQLDSSKDGSLSRAELQGGYSSNVEKNKLLNGLLENYDELANLDWGSDWGEKTLHSHDMKWFAERAAEYQAQHDGGKREPKDDLVVAVAASLNKAEGWTNGRVNYEYRRVQSVSREIVGAENKEIFVKLGKSLVTGDMKALREQVGRVSSPEDLTDFAHHLNKLFDTHVDYPHNGLQPRAFKYQVHSEYVPPDPSKDNSRPNPADGEKGGHFVLSYKGFLLEIPSEPGEKLMAFNNGRRCDPELALQNMSLSIRRPVRIQYNFHDLDQAIEIGY